MISRRPASGTMSRLPMRIAASFGAQGLTQVVRIFEQLLLIPLFVSAWGVALYNDWLILAAASFFLYFVDFGSSLYFSNRIQELASRGDIAGFNRAFGVANALILTLCASAALILGASTLVIDWPRLLGLSSLDHGEATAMLLIEAGATFIMIPALMRHGIYRAFGQFGRGELIYGLCYGLSQVITLAVLLVLHAPPIVASGVFVLTPTLFWTALLVDQRRRFPGFRLRLVWPTRTELAEIAHKSLLLSAFPISSNLIYQAPVLLMGAMGVAPAIVVAFTMSRTITGMARQFALQFSISAGVELAHSHARHDGAGVRRLYARAGIGVAVILGGLGGFILVAADPFVHLWTHGQARADWWLIVMLLAPALLSGPAQLTMSFLRLSNRPGILAIGWLGHSILGIALAALLIPLWGGVGAALGLAVAETLCIGLFVPIAAAYRFDLPVFRPLVLGYLVLFAVGTLSWLLARLAADLTATGDFVHLCLMGVVWSALILPLPATLLLARRPLLALSARLTPARQQGGL